MVTPVARRRGCGLPAADATDERAAGVPGHRADRTSAAIESRRPDDGAMRERLKALAAERRRFGYRRLHVLLAARGPAPSTGSGCSGSTARSG